MNNKTQSSQPYRGVVEIVDKGVTPEERKILATVPSHPITTPDQSHEPAPELYRQALKVMVGTPEIESHLSVITATMIVSIFGGWLATKAIKTLALPVFFIAMMIGILLGILVGQGVIPVTMLSVLLIATMSAMLFLLGILVRDMSQRQVKYEQRLASVSATRRIALPARTPRSVSRRRTIG